MIKIDYVYCIFVFSKTETLQSAFQTDFVCLENKNDKKKGSEN